MTSERKTAGQKRSPEDPIVQRFPHQSPAA
jgi:hypothetical protein